MGAGIIIMIIVLLFSVVFHEVSHGVTAFYLGDPTAKRMGRLTLNPVPHIDPMMTVMLPLMLGLLSGWTIMFGGAKPVPVNPFNFKNMKRDMAITAAAGPLSNLTLIIVSIILYKLLLFVGLDRIDPYIIFDPRSQTYLESFFFYAVLINTVLMVFNLFPIPPLDGSKILMGFLNHEQADKFESVSRYGIGILIGLLVLGNIWISHISSGRIFYKNIIFIAEVRFVLRVTCTSIF
jgi:Zn-dependent protease